MSLQRFLGDDPAPREGALRALDPEQVRHLRALRLAPGEAVELLLPAGAWRAEVAEVDRGRAVLRLVAPLEEDREAPHPVTVFLPVTAQISLVDDMIPPVVELGASHIQPVFFTRSEGDLRRCVARMDRWRRILEGAAQQSHRSRLPALHEPASMGVLLACPAPQKWVAFEGPRDQPNPPLLRAPIALASGPEGGITDEEMEALEAAGWNPVNLGKSILRAVTAPTALLGAVRFGWEG
ncbi:MAG: 16S rRNA (uracil(1498)-N(3))-methyltransferase [Acidobacteria bacterium]|nr:16S rRNA (uracil(1498)-N(3))-methyltransferase [Acidobacteriota bacterium]